MFAKAGLPEFYLNYPISTILDLISRHVEHENNINKSLSGEKPIKQPKTLADLKALAGRLNG